MTFLFDVLPTVLYLVLTIAALWIIIRKIHNASRY